LAFVGILGGAPLGGFRVAETVAGRVVGGAGPESLLRLGTGEPTVLRRKAFVVVVCRVEVEVETGPQFSLQTGLIGRPGIRIGRWMQCERDPTQDVQGRIHPQLVQASRIPGRLGRPRDPLHPIHRRDGEVWGQVLEHQLRGTVGELLQRHPPVRDRVLLPLFGLIGVDRHHRVPEFLAKLRRTGSA
jgi:hypothetical protein